MMRLSKHALKLAQLLALTATFATGVSAQTAIHVYGPGLAKEFTEFLLSPAGGKIFAKWGWDTRQ